MTSLFKSFTYITVEGSLGFPGGSVVKESVCDAGDTGYAGSIPGSGRSPRRMAWQPTPLVFPGESHGQRSLVGYSPWGRTESDMTEATAHTRTQEVAYFKVTLPSFQLLFSD